MRQKDGLPGPPHCNPPPKASKTLSKNNDTEPHSRRRTLRYATISPLTLSSGGADCSLGLIYTAHTLRSKAVRLVGLLAIKVRDRMLVWPRLLTPMPSARCVSVLVRIFTVQFSHLFLPLPIPNPPFSLFVVYLCLEVGDLEVEIHLVESAGQTNSSE